MTRAGLRCVSLCANASARQAERPIRRWSVPRVPEGSLPHEADLIRVSPTAHRPKHRLVCRPMEEVITDEDETDRDRGGRGGVTGVARRGGPRQDAGGRSEHTCQRRHSRPRLSTRTPSRQEIRRPPTAAPKPRARRAASSRPRPRADQAPSPTDPEVMRMPRATWTISSTGRSDPSVPTEGGSGAAGPSLTPSAAGRRRRPEAKRRRIPLPLGEHRPRSGRRVPPRSRC